MANTKLGDIVLAKQTGTVLTLATEGKYVSDNVYFTISVPSGAATVAVSSTDANAVDDSNLNNIYDIIGSKSTSAPASGYYFLIDASGAGSSSVTTAGWFETGSLGSASGSTVFYFPIQAATATTNGSNVVTPSASVSGTNALLSNVNNGISVTATGGGTATATINTTVSQAGYAPSGPFASGTANASSTTTTASSYLAGVTIPAPASGDNEFSITVPNDVYDPIMLTFSVDSNGNSEITSDDTALPEATGVSF